MATHDELKRIRDNLACALNMGGVQDAARWTIDELDRLLAKAVPAGVPEVTGIGRDADHPRALVLYLRTEPSDDSVRAIQDALRAPLTRNERRNREDLAELLQDIADDLRTAIHWEDIRGMAKRIDEALRRER